MDTIAILTDFGLNDNFVGVIKGVILNINPDVNIVDISHLVKPQDIITGAFLLKTSYKYFPKGSIFLTVIDPGVGSERRPIIIHSKDYYFVGPDNGVLSIAAKENGIKDIVAIGNKKYMLKEVSNTFHGRDIFAPVSAHISKGKDCHLFGRRLSTLKELNIPSPKIRGDALKGEIIYIDRFGNLVTNIDNAILKSFTKHSPFKIKNTGISGISNAYASVKINQALAIFGSFGLLEISVNKGSAEKYFNITAIGAPIEVIRQEC